MGCIPSSKSSLRLRKDSFLSSYMGIAVDFDLFGTFPAEVLEGTLVTRSTIARNATSKGWRSRMNSVNGPTKRSMPQRIALPLA